MASDEPFRQRLEYFYEDLYDESLDDAAAKASFSPLYDALQNNIERYSQHQWIFSGGMKDILKVHDAHLARSVVMARPKRSLGSNCYDAFLREAHITARLDHPNIIKLFDMGVGQDGRPFFTLEFKCGSSLRQALQSNGMLETWTMPQRLELMLKVSAAMAYAHSGRVLHLDLKAENIQVGDYGEVQICDWGMGVIYGLGDSDDEKIPLLDPDLYGAQGQQSGGTPEIMAPEQKDKSTARHPRMDIFSLGRLLNELGQTCRSKLHWSRDLQHSLDQIVQKACANSPEDRYASVDSFRQDVNSLLNGYRTSVDDGSLWLDWMRSWRRHKGFYRLCIFFALVATLGTWVFIVLLQQRRLEAERLQKLAEQASEKHLLEKIHSQVLVDQMSKDMLEHTRSIYHWHLNHGEIPQVELVPFLFNMADDAAEHNPNPSSSPWMQKIWYAFILQDFKTVSQMADWGYRKNPHLISISRKFYPKLNSQGYLSTADFIDFITEIVDDVSRMYLLERCLESDLSRHGRNDVEVLSIIRATLGLINPQWDASGLESDGVQNSLSIKGTALLKCSIIKRSLLRFMDPTRLIIDCPDLEDNSFLRDLSLWELELYQSAWTDLSPLLEMRSLRTLRLYNANPVLLDWLKNRTFSFELELLD